MLPQSRNTTVRSAMSAGGCWIRPSSAKKRYSRGSGRSSGEMNIARVLAERAQQPLHRRPASRARRRRGSRAWRARSAGPRAGARAPARACCCDRARRRSSAADLLDQLLDAQRAVGGVVVDELERRRALQAQLAGEPRLQEAVGAAQAFERRLALARLRRPAVARRARSRTRGRGVGLALVLTSVTVTNPTRGSLRSPATASPITWRIASSTRRMRPVLILSLQFRAEASGPCPRARRAPAALRRTARAPPAASHRSRARRPRAGPGSWSARCRTRSRWRPRARPR